MKNLCLLPTLAMLTGCASLGNQLSDAIFIPTPGSDKREGERVTLELAYSTRAPTDENRVRKPDTVDERYESLKSFGLSLGPAAIADTVVATISQTLLEESKRYEATYSSEAVSDQFYHAAKPLVDHSKAREKETPTDIRFAGFKMTREVAVSGETKAAITICGVALPGQEDAFFFLVPVSYSMNYTKAKLVGFDLTSPFGVDLLNPWEIVTDPLSGQGFNFGPKDNDVDLNLAITFEYLHFTDDSLATTKVGPYTVTSRSVSLNPQKRAGYFDGYSAFLKSQDNAFQLPCNEQTTIEDIAVLRDRIQDLKFDDAPRMQLAARAKLFPSPKRAFDDGKRGNGNFTMKVQATEFDSYGNRVKEVSDAFESKKESTQQKLTNFFSQ
jgi:hypothetical protein